MDKERWKDFVNDTNGAMKVIVYTLTENTFNAKERMNRQTPTKGNCLYNESGRA